MEGPPAQHLTVHLLLGGQRHCPPPVPREGAAVPTGSAPRPRGGAVLRLHAVTVLHSLHWPGDVLPATTTSRGCRGGFLSAPRRPALWAREWLRPGHRDPGLWAHGWFSVARPGWRAGWLLTPGGVWPGAFSPCPPRGLPVASGVACYVLCERPRRLPGTDAACHGSRVGQQRAHNPPPGCWGIVLSRARLGSGGRPWGSRSSRRCARPGQGGRHGGGLPRGPECSSHPSTKAPVPPDCSWGPGAWPASLVTSRCAYSQGSRAEGGRRHEPDGPEEARGACKPV